MPRSPDYSQIASRVRASTFGSFGAQLQNLAMRGTLIPLHIGDTYLMPPAAARSIDLEQANIYRLASAEGDNVLRRAIEQRLDDIYGFPAQDREVFVVPGGTGGVSLASEALFDPGDEVIVLTPTWPIVFGVLERRGVVIREVRVGVDGWPDETSSFRQRLRAAVTSRTAGIYACNPNNPSGFLYPRSYLEDVKDLMIEEDLWLIDDIAYIDLIFNRGPFASLSADPRLTERCLTVGSFTKPFGLAGLRVGYLAVPKALAELVVRLQTHTTLHVSMAGQAMALACLEGKEDRAIADSYRRGAELVKEQLSLEFRAPQAGAFVFLDLRPLGIESNKGTLAFLSRCLDEEVSLCPGNVFGSGFEAFVRLCYTCVPEDALAEAIRRINGVVQKWKA